jgi:hypothetical protein
VVKGLVSHSNFNSVPVTVLITRSKVLVAGEAEGTCISDVTSKPLGIPADENKDLDITYSYTVSFKVRRLLPRRRLCCYLGSATRRLN